MGYVNHMRKSRETTHAEMNGSLLPRFFGAYRFAGQHFFVANNVFADIKKDALTIFDLKGSSWDRKQRRTNSEYLELDLLEKDRKFALNRHDGIYDALHKQLKDDADLLSYVRIGASYGVMDYSLILGIVPSEESQGIPVDDRYWDESIGESVCEKARAIFGIIDVLQPWTGHKMAERFVKTMIGRNEDPDGYHRSSIISAVRPDHYKDRFLDFMKHLFCQGSWLENQSLSSVQIAILPIYVEIEVLDLIGIGETNFRLGDTSRAIIKRMSGLNAKNPFVRLDGGMELVNNEPLCRRISGRCLKFGVFDKREITGKLFGDPTYGETQYTF